MAKTLRQLLDEGVSAPPFLVFPILPKNGKLLLYAPAKHLKSTVLINMLYDFGEGLPILGNGSWTVDRPIPSLLIEQELGQHAVYRKYKAIDAFRGGLIAPENIHVLSKERSIKLDTDEGIARLSKEIEESMPIEILALDPLRKLHFSDENDNTMCARIIDVMDYLIKTYDLSIILVHHSGYPSEYNKTGHPRGCSMWRDDADTILKLTRPIPNNFRHIRVQIEELRHAEPPPKFDLILDPDTYTFNRVTKE